MNSIYLIGYISQNRLPCFTDHNLFRIQLIPYEINLLQKKK